VGFSFGFGRWAWPLEASHCARPKAPLLYFIGYFQLISLDSQQSLATQRFVCVSKLGGEPLVQ
jgi:hypothetical protein